MALIAQALDTVQVESTALGRPSPGSRSLRTNFLWAVFGNGVYSACQWGMLVIIARFGSTAMLGRFALALALTAPIVMFTNLHLQGVIRTDTSVRFKFNEYLSLRLTSSGLAMIAIFLLVSTVGYSRETALVIIVIGFAKCIESISNLIQGFLQLHERMDLITQSRLVKGPLSLIALGAGVHLTQGLLGGVITLTVAWVAVLVFVDIRNLRHVLVSSSGSASTVDVHRVAKEIRPAWNLKRMRSLAWLALPLGFDTLITSLNVNVPRYFLERRLGEDTLGVFAAMAYLLIAGMTVMQALGESASPRLAAHYDHGDFHEFRRVLSKLILFGTISGLLGIVFAILFGREFLGLLYSEDFAQQSSVLTLLAVAGALSFVSIFLLYGLLAAKRFRLQVPVSLSTLGVTTLLSATLIPAFGLRGAAFALIAANVVQLAIAGALVHRLFRQESSSRTQQGVFAQ